MQTGIKFYACLAIERLKLNKCFNKTRNFNTT